MGKTTDSKKTTHCTPTFSSQHLIRPNAITPTMKVISTKNVRSHITFWSCYVDYWRSIYWHPIYYLNKSIVVHSCFQQDNGHGWWIRLLLHFTHFYIMLWERIWATLFRKIFHNSLDVVLIFYFLSNILNNSKFYASQDFTISPILYSPLPFLCSPRVSYFICHFDICLYHSSCDAYVCCTITSRKGPL